MLPFSSERALTESRFSNAHSPITPQYRIVSFLILNFLQILILLPDLLIRQDELFFSIEYFLSWQFPSNLTSFPSPMLHIQECNPSHDFPMHIVSVRATKFY